MPCVLSNYGFVLVMDFQALSHKKKKPFARIMLSFCFVSGIVCSASSCSQITGPWLKASNHCGKKIYNQPTLGHLGQNSGVHPGQNPSTALGGSKRGQGQYREVHDLRNPPALISGLPSRTLPNRLCKNLRENLYQRKIKQNNKGFNI